MLVLNVRNVHEALPEALLRLEELGYQRDSRNGPVRLFPMPVTTVYERPRERVIFWPERDANPFFHLMEALWMLGGRNDLAFVEQFVKRMREFSDDGKTLHGAYGFRWRRHFDVDQLRTIAVQLQNNPDDRRCVLTMWDPAVDLGRSGRDVPCNTQAYFSIQDSRLNMTVLNRSNDLVWGAYGANAVHFSLLQEYLASLIGVSVGTYYQVSNNLHAYLSTLEQVRPLAISSAGLVGLRNDDSRCPYRSGEVHPYPLMETSPSVWDRDLQLFLSDGPLIGFEDRFFRRVANPMLLAYRTYKAHRGPGRYDLAREILSNCLATDWRLAALDWLQRRETKEFSS